MVEAMAQVGGLIMLEGGGGEGKIILHSSSFCFVLLFVLSSSFPVRRVRLSPLLVFFLPSPLSFGYC